MITENILNKLPTWYKDINEDKQYLVLTNDFDSLLSCGELQKIFDIQIGGYYSFESGLWLNKERTQGKEPIFVDLSILKGKTFDNHYTFMKNNESINLNGNISTYNRKFNGSALALICALYNIDLSKKTTTQLTTLLAIDGWYRGYYNKGGKYKDINLYWMDALHMTDYLLPILESNKQQYFIDFTKRYCLNEEIYMDDFVDIGHLKCQINWVQNELPDCKFELVQPVTKKYISKYEAQKIYNNDKDKIFSGAETYYNQYSVSLKKEG